MYCKLQAAGKVNRKRSEALVIEQWVRQGCPLSSLLYVLALEASQPCAVFLLLVLFRKKYSRLDIKAVKKAVVRYEQIAGAKINFDKSEGLWLGAWRSLVPLPGPFRRSDESICILGVWFGPELQLERNWSEVKARADALVGTWLRR